MIFLFHCFLDLRPVTGCFKRECDITTFIQQVDFNTNGGLNRFLKEDRQWPRHLRISHAKMQLFKADTLATADFWKAVLDANGTEPVGHKPQWHWHRNNQEV